VVQQPERQGKAMDWTLITQSWVDKAPVREYLKGLGYPRGKFSALLNFL
jgi:hypothetical protein